MTAQELTDYVLKSIVEVSATGDDADSAAIEQTRSRLESQSYTPILMMPAPDFLSFSKSDMVKEIERVANLSDGDMLATGFEAGSDFLEMKSKHISLLLYHFKLLVRLRRDEPEAWDEIDELYSDD